MKKATTEKKISFINQFDRSSILRQIDKMIDDKGIEEVIGVHGVDYLAERLMNSRLFRRRLNIENRKLRRA